MNPIIEKYQKNYIREMRKIVRHAPLVSVGCGVIIENNNSEILLQKRRDNGCWGILGGSMEIGEKIRETAKREVMEEAGIEIKELELFGLYSGEERIIFYPNKDVVFGIGVIFKTRVYSGTIQNDTEEVIEHRFFGRTELPDNLNKADWQIILDWASGSQGVIID